MASYKGVNTATRSEPVLSVHLYFGGRTDRSTVYKKKLAINKVVGKQKLL